MNKKVLSFALALSLSVATYAQNIVPMHNDKGQFGYGEKGSKTFTIKPQWDEARPFNEYGVAIVRKGQMFGLIDKSGKAIGKPLGYSVIEPYDGTDYWLVAVGGKRSDKPAKNRTGLCVYGFKGSLSYPVGGAKWGVLRKNGQAVIEPKYQELSNLMDDQMIAFQEKGLYGFIDKSGSVVFPAKYDVITQFNNQGVAAVRNKKGFKWSLVNKSGRTVISEDAGCQGFFCFTNDKFGSLNTIGVDTLLAHREIWGDPQRLMPMMKFNISWINTEHPYVVSPKVANKKKRTMEYTLYNLDGQQLIGSGSGISNIYAPSEGIAVVYKNESMGFYDLNSQSFTPTNNSRMYLPVKDGHSMSYNSKTNSDFYVVDKKGSKVSGNYDAISIAESRYIVRKGNTYGLITKQGKEIVPTECLNVIDANSGLFGIKASNGKFGYVDENGKTIIPLVYDDGSAFVGNYAVVSKAPEGSLVKKSGVIDKSNNIVIPLCYDKVCGYVDNDGRLQVWVADGETYSKVDNSSIGDATSLRLSATDYTDMQNTAIGVVVKNTKGLYGLLQNGKTVIPCSVANEELVGRVFQFMASRNVAEVSAVDARRIAAWTNDARNTFKLKDTIGDNVWDF